MNKTETERFEALWDNFISRLRGKLITKAKNQPLTYSLCNLILLDTKLCWGSSYDECGRWAMSINNTAPSKARLISQILTEDMRFSEIEPKKSVMKILNYAVPVAGSAAGFGIAVLLNANLVTRIVSAAVPMVLLAVTGLKMSEVVKDNKTKALINEYLAQLDKYKLSVLSVLSD